MLSFGQLSPAFSLQVLLPFMLIFLGSSLMSREKENRQLLFFGGNGVSLSRLLWGKFFALFAVAQLALLPLYVALALSAYHGETGLRCVLLGASYCAYATIICALSLLISTRARSSSQALAMGLSVWCVMTLMLPRIGAQVGSLLAPGPGFIELEIKAEQEVQSLGNFHNPEDPNFVAFRQKILDQYGKSSVEELPVNFGGLVMQEGERRTSDIVARHLASMREKFHAQNAYRRLLNWINPMMALQTVSMHVSGTDFWHHEDFLLQSESGRFEMIQALNRIHTEQIHFHNDREQRLARETWQGLPRASYVQPSLSLEHLLASLLALLAWVMVSLLTLRLTARRLNV
jgi:ABC-2 type transport system permease protein